jgi:hypothetical protein
VSHIATSSVSLAKLKVPAIKQVNPYAAGAEQAAKELCFELGIGLPHIDNYNTMSAFLFPEASHERLVTLILFFNFLYYVDDVYDRHVPGTRNNDADLFGTFLTAAKVFATGASHLVTDEPILRAAYELHCQFASMMPRIWLSRFAASLMAHLKSSLMGLEDLEHETGTLVERYNRIRSHDAGMESTLDLIEFAGNFVLESRFLNHRAIQDARKQVTDYCGLSNDLFSFEKEVVQHNSEFNVVTVMMREGASFESAVDQVIAQLNDMVDHFDELWSQLPLYGDADTNKLIEEYFAGLQYQLSAAYHWQFSTTRYRSPNSPFIELRESWVK